MNNLSKQQINVAWIAISNVEEYGWCGKGAKEEPQCYLCPEPERAAGVCSRERAVFLKNLLHVNGFPVSRPHVHTVAELAKQPIKGRKISCLTQWIGKHVEAVTCPDCGKNTLYRERRMKCRKCDSVYPEDKWDAGEPCDCGSMYARYYGVHSANGPGQLEFRRCQTPGCRWAGDYRPLTVQELAGAAQVLADEQLAKARTCPACGETSGNDQVDGAYLPITGCACGWRKQEARGEEK